jgi:hypothetical protein
LLVLAFVVVASVLWFGPEDTVEDAPIVEQEETVTPANEGPGTTEVADPVTASGPDIVVLALILLVIAADVVRRWRNSPRPPADAEPPTDVMLSGELGSAFEEAHHHLSEETDPRTAVLMAYASLERALADVDHDRNPAETPSEHLARAFANLPVSVTPAVRLGELYEIARFSREVITEQDRQEATRALDRARSSLVLAESGRS